MSQNPSPDPLLARYAQDGFTVDLIRGPSGVVLDNQKRTESRVYSTGGGGTLYNGQGHISAAQVNTVNTLHQQVWIREENGLESCLEMLNVDIPLRPGQVVTTLLATTPRRTHACLAALINHSSQKYSEVSDGHAINQRLGLLDYPGTFMAALAALGWVACVGFLGWGLLALLVHGLGEKPIAPRIWDALFLIFMFGAASYLLTLPHKFAMKKINKFAANLSAKVNALAHEIAKGPAPVHKGENQPQ